MRKIIALILSVMMLAALSLPALAQQPVKAQTLELPVGSELNSMLYYDDTLYLIIENTLYTFKPGDEAMVKFGEVVQPASEDGVWFSAVFNDAGSLYSVDWLHGKLYPASIADGRLSYGEPVDIDLDKYVERTEDGASFSTPLDVFAAHGGLWVLFRDPGAANQKTLERFDLKTGEKTTCGIEGAERAAEAADGKIYVVVKPHEENENRGEEESEMTLKLFDPESGAVEDAGTIAIPPENGGMFSFEKDTGCLVYSKGGNFFRRTPDGSVEQCCALPVTDVWFGGDSKRLALFPGGLAHCNLTRKLLIRSTDPSVLPENELVIYGYMDDDAGTGALLEMPDTAMRRMEGKWFSSAKELGQALVSGEDGIDLMCLDIDFIDVDNLYKKGYCADLSQSEAVKEYLDKVYPALKDVCVKDGKIYAVPVEITPEATNANPIAAKTLGIRLPETFAELCDAMAEWEKQADERSDYTFADATDRDWPFRRMLSLYGLTLTAKGETLKLDTPLFREMAAAYERLRDAWAGSEEISMETEEEMNEFFNKTAVMEPYVSLDLRQINSNLRSMKHYEEEETEKDKNKGEDSDGGSRYVSLPMLLKAGEQEAPVVGYGARLMMINSQSKHTDNALKFIENYIANLRNTARAMMCPEENEPIENPSYHRDLERQKEYIKKMEKKAAEAEGAEKSQMEKSLEMMRDGLKQMESESRYTVSAEAFALYRECMRNGVLKTTRRLDGQNDDVLSALHARYEQGQIDLENYIREADTKLRLMQLEAQ